MKQCKCKTRLQFPNNYAMIVLQGMQCLTQVPLFDGASFL